MVNAVGPDAVGSRMVIRHHTGGTGPSGGPELTDVIGHVRSVDGSTVTLQRRDGSMATVALSDIVAAKVVPER